MNIIELLEGTTPKMPGAVNGVQVMTPQQFVAKAGDMPDEEVDEGFYDSGEYHNDKSSGDYGMDLRANNVGISYKDVNAGANDGQHGRPVTKLSGLSKSLPTDPFGRTSGTIPKGKKGSIHHIATPNERSKRDLALDRIRKLSGLDEATTLPASTRDLKGQEFQDYMNRIKGTDDIDKKTGQVKLDKKGNEKYVSGKTKGDKYKMQSRSGKHYLQALQI